LGRPAGQQGGGEIESCLALFLLLMLVYLAVAYWPIGVPTALVLTGGVAYAVKRSRRRAREKQLAPEAAAAVVTEMRKVEEARSAARMPDPRSIRSWRDAEFYARDVLAGLGFDGVRVTNSTRDGGGQGRAT
jgi:hypothetical protein